MSITRHDQSAILSQAVKHGDTVYLAGIVAKDLNKVSTPLQRFVAPKADDL